MVSTTVFNILTVTWLSLATWNVVVESSNLPADVLACSFSLMEKSPADIRVATSQLANQMTDDPHFSLQYLLLLEPYITYLMTIEDNSSGKDNKAYLNAFTNYCDQRTGIQVFISCMKTSDSFSAQKRRTRSPYTANILGNLYSRYCNVSGGVKDNVVRALAEGSTSEEIYRLVSLFDNGFRNGTFICFDVVERSMQIIGRLLGSEFIEMETFFEHIKRAIEVFTRCLIVTVSPNEKALVLKEHLEIVLLELIDSNIADVTRVQMRKSRQTLAVVGYMNVMAEYGEPEFCSETGTYLLFSNKNLVEVSGTIIYDNIGDALLPYLAAVHIKFPVYDKYGKRIGLVSYNTVMEDDVLYADLTSLWYTDSEEYGRVSSNDHGVSIEQTAPRFVELVSLTSGTYISIRKAGKMLTLLIRMDTKYIFQSVGLAVEPCDNNGQTPIYQVLRTSTGCRAMCTSESVNIRTLCRKDCFMSGEVKQLSEVYSQVEVMYETAERKDSLVNEKPLLESTELPADVPIVVPALIEPDYVTYKYEEEPIPTVSKTVTKHRPSQPLIVNIGTIPTPVDASTKRHDVPGRLGTPPSPGARSTATLIHSGYCVVTAYVLMVILRSLL